MSTAKIGIRVDTAANWTSANPTLLAGEQGHESDTGNRKIGDGATTWSSLPYIGVQPGDIKTFGGTSAPFGWLSANGAAVSRTAYAALFGAIGTTWGSGNGSTTFNVPDLRGAFVRGAGSHGAETMADGNAFAGPAVGSFENDRMQRITGYIRRSGGAGLVNKNQANESGAFSHRSTDELDLLEIFESEIGAGIEFDSADSPGARTDVETAPFSAGVLYCVKI